MAGLALGNAFPGGDAQAMAGPIVGMLGKAIGAMLASQVGSGLGALAGEVLSASDVGLPLGAPGKAALVVENVKEFASGLDVSEEDVLLYLALREAAHQRLFAHVPWLREHLLGAVTDYAKGIEVNTANLQSSIEEKMRGIDMNNPDSMRELMEGGMFEMDKSPAAAGRTRAARGHPGPRRGLGRRGRQPGDRRADAQREQAPGGRTPPPRGRRSRRGHLRRARRARAAAAPAARRLDAVGRRCAPVRAPRPATASG